MLHKLPGADWLSISGYRAPLDTLVSDMQDVPSAVLVYLLLFTRRVNGRYIDHVQGGLLGDMGFYAVQQPEAHPQPPSQVQQGTDLLEVTTPATGGGQWRASKVHVAGASWEAVRALQTLIGAQSESRVR